MKKIDKNYFILTILSLLFIFLVVPQGSIFGSYIDWLPQHITFPEYFRNLFYETKDLFPDFALALGAGQNIYNFSYYGFLNPILLPSYLLPFVSMKDYIIIINIILYVATALVSYKWLKSHFESTVSLILSILLISAAPILFHFHRHFMFVSYFPFLIFGLIGIEEYFKEGKRFKLALSTFFIVMMSYYYSIPSILVFIIYGIFIYLRKEKKLKFLIFIKDGFFFTLPIFAGILLSGIFLLPTASSIFGGRESSSNLISTIDLIKPNLNMTYLFYNAYGIGIGALAFIAIIYNLYQGKRDRLFLAISILICLTLPLISYILNGGLYIREKVFIPFIPLIIMLIGFLLKDVIKRKIDRRLLISIIFTLILVRFDIIYIYIDIAVTLLILFLYQKCEKKEKKFLFLLIIPISAMLIINSLDKFVEKDQYNETITSKKEIGKLLKKEKDIVRFSHLDDTLYNVNKIYSKNYYKDSMYSSVYNSLYRNFYKNIFHNSFAYRNKLIISQNSNLLYQMFMGNKYLYSEKEMVGYETISGNISENKDVLPVFYISDKIVNENEFDRLKYPNNVLTLLNSTVIEDEKTTSEIIEIPKIFLEENIVSQKNIKINKKNGIYNIKAKSKNKLILELDQQVKGKILLLDFSLGKEWDCSKGDASIEINKVVNTHTCKQWMYKNKNRRFHYVLSNKNLRKLEIKFNEGNYIISNINTYAIDYNLLRDINRNRNLVETKEIKGDQIKLNVTLNKDSYLVTSIPYDKGFTIKDNGKKISYQVVNKAFVGAKLSKGKHNIVIEYKAPLKTLGIIFSTLGLFSIIIIYFMDKKADK